MNRPDHLFVSSSDGGLYDTRKLDWHKAAPLRPLYCWPFKAIENTAQLRASLRATFYPGYDAVFLADDGASLCAQCVRDEWRQVSYSIRHATNNGWRVRAAYCAADCSDGESCDHCGKMLDPYYDDEQETR